MNKTLYFLVGLFTASTAIYAQNLNQNGNITATNNHDVTATRDLIANQDIRTSGGYVRAQTYFYTPGYLSVGGSGSFGTTLYAGGAVSSGSTITGANVQGNSWVYSPGYVQSPTGLFTNVLRTGGSQTPANLSVAFGVAATAPSYSSVAIGRNNATSAIDGTAVSTTTWVDKDPLLIVGNGNGTVGDPNQYRNAFAIYKDGTITISKPQGDIGMGEFGVPPAP